MASAPSFRVRYSEVQSKARLRVQKRVSQQSEVELLTLRVRNRLVDELEEFAAVQDLYEGSAFGLAGSYPDGGGVLDADFLAEGVVGFDLGGQFAVGVQGEGKGEFVAGGEFFSEVAQVLERGDGRLVGEDFVAVFVTELFRFDIEPAGVDGGLEAPGVEGEREVVADPGNFVGVGGFFEKRVGGAAVGALHVYEFDDGYAGARRRLERGRVVDLGGGRRSAELGLRGRCGKEANSEDGQGSGL